MSKKMWVMGVVAALAMVVTACGGAAAQGQPAGGFTLDGLACEDREVLVYSTEQEAWVCFNVEAFQGPAGPRGDPGKQGPDGDPGEPGAPADPADVSAAMRGGVIEELRIGLPAMVQETVAGMDGLQGPQGEIGPQGEPGPYRPQAIIASPAMFRQGEGGTARIDGIGFIAGHVVSLFLMDDVGGFHGSAAAMVGVDSMITAPISILPSMPSGVYTVRAIEGGQVVAVTSVTIIE